MSRYDEYQYNPLSQEWLEIFERNLVSRCRPIGLHSTPYV